MTNVMPTSRNNVGNISMCKRLTTFDAFFLRLHCVFTVFYYKDSFETLIIFVIKNTIGF